MKTQADERSAPAPAERKFDLYRAMLLIRRFDEIAALRELRDSAHASVFRGEEAVAAGAALALERGDYLISAYREHGHRLAAGADAKIAMAYRCGKLGAAAIRQLDMDLHFAGGSRIAPDALAVAAGLGLSIAYDEAPRAVCCVFGDERLAGGAFHEALNLASIWNLPIVFICENNFQPMGTIVDAAVCQEELYRLAAAYKMPGIRVDGMEALEVHGAAAASLARARAGEGPSLIEAVTYRPAEDSSSETEKQIARERDPIAALRDRILDDNPADQSRLDQIAREIEVHLDEAAAFANSLTAAARERAAP